MAKHTFIQAYPLQVFPENDATDYSEINKYFIQCLKSIESIMDIDAFIMDFQNRKIIYVTKGSSLYSGNISDEKDYLSASYIDEIICKEDMELMSVINKETWRFIYSMPVDRRINIHFTRDFRIVGKCGKTVLINQKASVLDLTKNGVLRLGLCVLNYPTNFKLGKAYIKMTDTNSIYEFMTSTKKYVEIKTQKLTSKAIEVLNLASTGKNEAEIANMLGITIHTVKYHKQKIFSQTGTKNIAEAIQWINDKKKVLKRRK